MTKIDQTFVSSHDSDAPSNVTVSSAPLADAMDDVDEASMESFPASDPPAIGRGNAKPAGESQTSQEREPNKDDCAGDDSSAKCDDKYWRKAILQRSFYRPEVGFDRYLWALRFGPMARKRHKGDVSFESAVAELEAGWKEYGGPSGLSWEEARDAVSASWERTNTLLADSICRHGGFKSPPTFSENSNVVPRNIDEPNS